MYLIVIAWFYVTVMMALAEAASPQGSILGAIITFALYGLLPMAILVYILGTPERKRKLKAQREAAQRAYADELVQAQSHLPNTSGHTTGTAQGNSITPVREEH